MPHKKLFKSRDIPLLDWPALSPDLNPIEDLWSILSAKVFAKSKQYTIPKELKSPITAEWEKIDMAALKNLVCSIYASPITAKKGAKNPSATKPILKGLSGEFRPGELSVIIGSSGCGKSTLLNLLSGYRTQTTQGNILVNGSKRDLRTFQNVSRYILQEDKLIPNFTIMETVMFASHFKMESVPRRDTRIKLVHEILETFHLSKSSNTMVANISTGELKRLCIALEMMDNPSVLFLDEPTTGLDEFSAFQCMRILKQLATSGCTIICSLHCPSAKLSEMFDKVYVMSSGECIYQGTVSHIVPYLKEMKLSCPVTYNPLDFIIDISTQAFGDFQREMSEKIENGKVSAWTCPSHAVVNSSYQSVSNKDGLELGKLMENQQATKCSWWMEYRFLFMRFIQQMWRDKLNFKLRIATYIVCCSLTGFTFLEIGWSSKNSIFYYPFVLASLIFFGFAGMAPMIANVPRDIEYMKREYFNRWYCLSSYYMALITSQLPILCPMSFIGAALLYFISEQPIELNRFLLYFHFIILVSVMAGSFGLLLGASFKSLQALFAGPIFILIMSIFAYQRVCATDLTSLQEFVIPLSYMTYAIEGLMYSLLAMDHEEFPCPSSDVICFGTKPKYVLKMFGHSTMNISHCTIILIAVTIICAILAFGILKYRLNFKKKSK
ncbi:ATP-binding cassette sub-family G member 1-like [Haematobia irritans]|uniref:ATP-binding cassette sub-family G member 1-like n=1 Tax=Haematobia irritans TaxID=7368 RepID=UPI003F4F76FB